MTNPQLCKNLLALIRSLSDADLQLATLMLAHFGIVLVAFPFDQWAQRQAMPGDAARPSTHRQSANGSATERRRLSSACGRARCQMSIRLMGGVNLVDR
jgi:hypothetical protein